MSSVDAKLQQCADQLTADELAELAAIDTETAPSSLSEGLHEKLQRASDGLTDEERAEIRETDEVSGYLIKLPIPETMTDANDDGIPDGAAGAGSPLPFVKKGINRFIFHQNTNPLF